VEEEQAVHQHGKKGANVLLDGEKIKNFEKSVNL
jgi:hypothetical protein